MHLKYLLSIMIKYSTLDKEEEENDLSSHVL
jgi:hypothetical protein